MHCINASNYHSHEAPKAPSLVLYREYGSLRNPHAYRHQKRFANMSIAPSLQDLKGSLRPDFHWGFATAAAQVEGAIEDGKGLSIWDTFARVPGKVKDGSDPSQAVRSYDFYKQDVQLLKSLGVTAYRFSLSWSRIIPSAAKTIRSTSKASLSTLISSTSC